MALIVAMSEYDEGVRRIKACDGMVAKVAKHIGVTYQAVAQWRRVPATRVLKVAEVTGIPPHELRPDLYPAPNVVSAA